MAMHLQSLGLTALVSLVAAAVAPSQTVQSPYNSDYSIRTLGTVPGVPTPLGGVTFKYDDPDVLLVGGSANQAGAAVYQIRVTRDATGSITGFNGTATQLATSPYIDGGLQYGPNNVLFYTRYPRNELGQIKPGSTTTDKVVTFSLGTSPGAMSFVPPGYQGAGKLKVVGYSGGQFASCDVVPDGNGTFDLANFAQTGTVTGGPEGLLYPPPGSPQIPNYSRVLVGEYAANSISLWDVDNNGDPIPNTRTAFITGIANPEGATVDPTTGLFVFSSFLGGNQIYVVDGFGICGSFSNYGAGIPGTNGVTPVIRGIGCASIGEAIRFEVGQGLPSASGAFNIGTVQLNLPVFNGFVLTNPEIPISHTLDSQGRWGATLNTPNDPGLVGRNLYFQAAYVDPGALFGISASDGLDMFVR